MMEQRGETDAAVEDAQQRLSSAYDAMTPEDIRAHALALAGVIASQNIAFASTVGTIRVMVDLRRQERAFFKSVMLEIRRAASMQATHRQKDARRHIASLADAVGPLLQAMNGEDLDAMNDPVTHFLDLRDAWPDVFDPKPLNRAG
ncbi:hypothetical protein [Rhizobium rhizosphaerae]|nr:hypothetical protein [Xaviernesmea rhizosphaerae]